MPIYEYSCHDCGKIFDVMQKIADAPLTQCRCEKAGKVTKNLTAAGFALKGSGWYATDFKGGNSGKPAETKADTKADAPAPASGEAGSPASAPASAPAAAPACGAGACGACS